MKRILTTLAAAAALTMPMAVEAQAIDCAELSPEHCARLKAAAGSDDAMNRTIYINGKLLDVESGQYTTGPDGEIFIRMRPDYDLAPHDPAADGEVAGTLTAAEIQSLCGGQEPEAKTGLPCQY